MADLRTAELFGRLRALADKWDAELREQGLLEPDRASAQSVALREIVAELEAKERDVPQDCWPSHDR